MIMHKYFLCQHTDSAHNHPVNLGNTIYQPIPSATQQEIKAKVSIWAPLNEIYKELRKGLTKYQSITRAYLISKINVIETKRH